MHLRIGHYALHLRVDHFPTPRQRLSAPGEAAKRRRSWPQEINEYTRYATVADLRYSSYRLCELHMGARGSGYALAGISDSSASHYYFVIASILTMTAGTVFLMWLGEQIDEYGIGNGISLIIMSGIVARIPRPPRFCSSILPTGPVQALGASTRRRRSRRSRF